MQYYMHWKLLDQNSWLYYVNVILYPILCMLVFKIDHCVLCFILQYFLLILCSIGFSMNMWLTHIYVHSVSVILFKHFRNITIYYKIWSCPSSLCSLRNWLKCEYGLCFDQLLENLAETRIVMKQDGGIDKLILKAPLLVKNNGSFSESLHGFLTWLFINCHLAGNFGFYGFKFMLRMFPSFNLKSKQTLNSWGCCWFRSATLHRNQFGTCWFVPGPYFFRD